MNGRMARLALIAFALASVGQAGAPAVFAKEASSPESRIAIEQLVTDGGIEIWHVNEPSIPVLSLEVAFRGGASEDAAAKAGVAFLMAGLLDEGAGALSADAFKAALEEKAIRMGFGADRDMVSASLQTLAPYTEEALRLFALALSSPRFEREAIERVRSQILVSLNRDASEPSVIASQAWFAGALAGHPYARPIKGTAESVKALTRADILAAHKAQIVRERMIITSVGPIEGVALAKLLDAAFGALPKGSAPAPLPPVTVRPASEVTVIARPIPQTVVVFGGPGIVYGDVDFMAAHVMNYILGGGGFSSRLMDEIREKRGLTYGVYTSLQAYAAGGLFTGSFSTANEAFPEALTILKDEIKRLAEGGVTEAELADAKTYMTGSFALRFDTNNKIAGQLALYRELGYPIDYINRRNEYVRAVTKEDVARVAKRLLDLDAMAFVAVGAPAGSE